MFHYFRYLLYYIYYFVFFFSSRRRHTRCLSDWSSDVCSSDLGSGEGAPAGADVRLAGETPTPVRFIVGERALLAPGDGHLALVPAGAPVIEIGRASCRERV